MDITVKNLYIKGSPRKIRPILHNLRGINAQEAVTLMHFSNKAASVFIGDLVKAGLAAAKERYMELDRTVIKEIVCNEGPRLKRIQPWSKGQSRPITKRKSHLVLTLSDNVTKEDMKIKEDKKTEDNTQE